MKTWLMALAVAALLTLVLPVVARLAHADDDLPRGYGHPADMTKHWYDMSCCSMSDCEPVDARAIVETKDGYVVLYRSSRGHVVGPVLVPFSDKKIHLSKDMDQHACSSSIGTLYCIYVYGGA